MEPGVALPAVGGPEGADMRTVRIGVVRRRLELAAAAVVAGGGQFTERSHQGLDSATPVRLTMEVPKPGPP